MSTSSAVIVLQRFRECQNLVESVVANLSAISNLISQKIVVEEAMRRAGATSSFSFSSLDNINSTVRSCMDPLGILLAFPDSALELIIAQHTEDVNALLRSISTSQQIWCKKLQQAKEAFKPQVGKDSEKEEFRVNDVEKGNKKNNNTNNKEKEEIFFTPQIMLGAHALLAVLSDMHGRFQELVLALRADLANPPRAIHLSLWINKCFSSKAEFSSIDSCISIISLEIVLEQLAEKFQNEWESCKTRHMVDEAWMMLAS